MKKDNRLLRRLAFFGMGVGLGVVISYFLLWRGRHFPAFWPQGIVLERLGRATYRSGPDSDSLMLCLQLDTALFRGGLSQSKVRFRRSLPHHKPCPVYALQHPALPKCLLMVQICDSDYSFYGLRTPKGLRTDCSHCKTYGK
ncbi:MAG: hypothetical protein N2110_00060 [Flavobacteriales bacterium]|nr:hypothetical protein [Flavobacteriales bacterium]MCX7767402.1 hypothetical protein [Flavobacteriales bacterium]MDW8410182.1 hypothetical protein [Flavobacteriales bacterium]